ncbi:MULTISPECIES: tetratricopeptide repeat protein [Flammeovirga]|uniref:Tetratricopeptide repeat protein n=1 Tax=Flammeovirga agarivorans TaxID=2726742 RepID=A0A7X8XXJ1_9BACT|nr:MULTISPECIES: tetratricopeptide repeat protein [Flammeovirga]NLR93213.1 tetratricopeptide repeat protein [Flammeovirga agarivorans]
MLLKKIISSFFVLFWLLTLSTLTQAQNINELKSELKGMPNGKRKVDKLIELARLELDQSNFNAMKETADQALKISQQVDYKLGEADALLMYSTMYKLKRDFDTAIEYGINSIKIYENVNEDIPLYEAYGEICFLYQDWGIYENAIEYELKALRVATRMNDKKRQKEIWHLLGNSYLRLDNFDQALYYFRLSAEYLKEREQYYHDTNDLQAYNTTLGKIASIEMKRGNYEEAKNINEEILANKERLGDEEGKHVPLNDIGVCYEKLGKRDKALTYFKRALEINRKYGRPESQNTTLLFNIGTLSNSNMRYSDALRAYNDVLKIRMKQGQPGPIAQAYTYIASVYTGKGNYSEAIKNYNNSIRYAREAGDYNQIERNLKQIGDIYKKTDDYKKALNVMNRLISLKDSIIRNEKLQYQKIANARIAAEQKEKEIDLLIMNQKVNEATMRRLEEENARKAQDLELLQREQYIKETELRQKELEQQQQKQELRLTMSALESEKKAKEIDQLQRTKKLNELKIQQTDAVALQKQQELELLERAKELQENKLREKENMQRVYFGMFGLLFVVLGLIISGYFQNRKKNFKLAAKNEEILGQNVEIEKQRDELVSAKTQIEKAYDNIQVLSEFGQKITAILDLESINWTAYAYVNTLMDAAVFGIGIYREKYEKIEYINFLENGLTLPLFSYDINKQNSLSTLCYKSSEEIVINDYESEINNFLRQEPEFKTSARPNSLVYLPLVTEKNLGVLTVQSYDKFAYSRNELNILRTLASYCAIALTNANAYQEIENKNKSITDSIRYAQTIQRAILPSNAKIQTGLLENFVYFRPKDIVSGDFYWFSKVEEKINKTSFSKSDVAERTFIAALDCTGHGVPGGFMSMIGNTLLNEIINQKQVFEPSKILDMLNEGVIDALHQENKSNDDGMDVCLCMVEKTVAGATKVVFSGAKRPLYVKEPGGTELLEYKGDNKSIGGVHRRKSSKVSFTNTVINVDPGTTIYLTTDGLQDQNNKNGRKFGKIQLTDLLFANAEKPMLEQKSALEKALTEHMGEIPQRDDITILGVRL